MNRLTVWSGLLLYGLLLCQLPAFAIDNVHIQMGSWSSEQLAAQEFDLDLELTAQGLAVQARAKQLQLPEPFGLLRDVSVSCTETRWESGQITCQSGKLRFKHGQLGSQSLSFSLRSQPEQASHFFTLHGLQLADTAVLLTVMMDSAGWQAAMKADAINLRALKSWLPLILTAEQLASLSSWDYQGLIGLDATLKGRDDSISELIIDWQSEQLGWTNASGLQVSEAIQGEGTVVAKSQAQSWSWHSELRLNSGLAYSDPVLLDMAANPLWLKAKGHWHPDLTQLNVEDMQFEQADILNASGSLSLGESGIKELQVITEKVELEKLYPVWLQPFLVGTAAAKLGMAGEVAAGFKLTDKRYQLQLDLAAVTIEDEAQRFSVDNLNGTLGWANSEQVMNTQLSWQHAKVYAVGLGPAEISGRSHDNEFTLTEQLNLPVLDGLLQVSGFSLKQHEDQHVDWTFEGLLTPVSMETLSQALDWPMLHGKLSGVIPKVTYQNQVLNIDGALLVKVFDGTTVIRDLKVRSPLGILPQVYANIDIQNLDLAMLTETFDFGKIDGRIAGYVHDLRLSNWQPVEFDASVATPLDNPGRRRISQRAVDNLTQIGGGAGVLSRSFLRFFDDFSYRQLGLACKLRNDVCVMSGIGKAEQGYYIVKGGGGLPPWINVVGYTERVDWSELIERLKAVRNSSGPVIQ